MNVGDLRKALKGLPADVPVVFDTGLYGPIIDTRTVGVDVRRLYEGGAHAGGGQVVAGVRIGITPSTRPKSPKRPPGR